MPADQAPDPRNLEALIDTLRGYLHSGISISPPKSMTFGREFKVGPTEQEGVEIRVHLQNEAPRREDGSEVVFMGVGLRISDGRDQKDSHLKWTEDIKRTAPEDRKAIHQKYEEGTWVSSSEGRVFLAVTDDEKSFGDILFPGECADYEMYLPTAFLPYIQIRVDGSVSRRHLLHFSESFAELRARARPLIVDTLRALNAVNAHQPMMIATAAVPEFGPRTTLNEIDGFRETLGRAVAQIKPTSEALNEVFYSAPNQDIRDQLKVVGGYLESVRMACEDAVGALSTGDTKRMREAAGSIKLLVTASQEVDRRTLELMARLGVTPEEANFPRKRG